MSDDDSSESEESDQPPWKRALVELLVEQRRASSSGGESGEWSTTIPITMPDGTVRNFEVSCRPGRSVAAPSAAAGAARPVRQRKKTPPQEAARLEREAKKEMAESKRDGFSWRTTALHVGAHEGMEVAVLKVLLGRKRAPLHINVRDGHGATALHVAAAAGRVELVGTLLDEGADVNLLDDCQKSVLLKFLEAAEEGRRAGRARRVVEEMTSLLCEGGADVNLADRFDRTPLLVACEMGESEVVRSLIESGANPNMADDTGELPLIAMVNACDCDMGGEIVSEMIEAGADVEGRSFCGSTALHIAATNNCVCVCESLLEFNADVDARTKALLTPLHLAVVPHLEWDDPLDRNEVIQLLLRYGASVDARDDQQATPLHHAVDPGACCDGVNMLLDDHADMEAVTACHFTPLQLAANMAPTRRAHGLFDGYEAEVDGLCTARVLLACGAEMNT